MGKGQQNESADAALFLAIRHLFLLRDLANAGFDRMRRNF
jgi:hypothetical protein